MSPDVIIAGIVSLLGLVSSVFIWWTNPQRIKQVKLKAIDQQITYWGVKRDEALIKGDVDGVTIAIANITGLLRDRSALLQ
jgi:hypothetical protein